LPLTDEEPRKVLRASAETAQPMRLELLESSPRIRSDQIVNRGQGRD